LVIKHFFRIKHTPELSKEKTRQYKNHKNRNKLTRKLPTNSITHPAETDIQNELNYLYMPDYILIYIVHMSFA